MLILKLISFSFLFIAESPAQTHFSQTSPLSIYLSIPMYFSIFS